MVDLHGQKHYRAATMGLIAFLDERRVEMEIVTAAGETVVIAFANDAIFKVEQQIARMERDCPEIATWRGGPESRPEATLDAVAKVTPARPTRWPQMLSLALIPALLLVLAVLTGGLAAADPLAGIQSERFQFDRLVLGILNGGAAALESQTLAQTARFQFDQEAKDHCPADTVVWVNRRSPVYNLSAERWYGRTAGGSFVCKTDAEKAGYRAKSER
ncbi:MAG: hypothetical protein IH626_13165 [Rhodospirillales bacterium]|nr:hypothetical protein [Rhodospirillales bacterium]